MPYPTLDSLPGWVKEMPKHAQEIYQAAWNSAFEQYKDEGRASATAITAVKTKYEKKDDKWIAKEANMESLKIIYQDIIQEVGKRNASTDSARIKKIVELCQELLSSEAEEEKAQEALKEAESTLVWLKEQPIIKTEDGVKFPAEAFAYAPDAEKPSEWKLRMWDSPTKEVSKKKLNEAAAMLSPGGLRGQRVEIPKEDLPAVKRKIRSAYRSLDIEEIPRWVKETEMRTFLTGYIPLTEAKIDKGVAKITVIKAGFNASKDRFYPADMLAKDYKVFEGLKMYADHPSEFDENNRPERSIRDWVATLKNVNVVGDTIIGEAHIVEPWMQEKLATLRDKGMLSEMGISINAVGSATEAEIEGVKTNYIEHITRGRSVDFVTEAGAGGLVEIYEADRDIDVDFISLTILKERRPDLVKEIETEVKNSKEVKKQVELEQENKELKESVDTLTKENETLKQDKENAEKASRIAETKATVEDAIGKADLPAPAKARILEKFKDAEKAEGLDEAIKAEQDYVAAINESGKVRDLGGQPSTEEDGKKGLAESFRKSHPEWSPEQVEIAVRGR